MDEQRNHMCQSKYLYSCCMHVLSTFIISILLDPKFFFLSVYQVNKRYQINNNTESSEMEWKMKAPLLPCK